MLRIALRFTLGSTESGSGNLLSCHRAECEAVRFMLGSTESVSENLMNCLLAECSSQLRQNTSPFGYTWRFVS